VRHIKPILAAVVLGVGAAHAEIGSNAAPGEFHVKFGVIHGLGEVADPRVLGALSILGQPNSADGEGFMAGLEYQYTEQLGVNGRYEVADFDIYQNFRLTLDWKTDLTEELSLHLAGGYNWQNILRRNSETDSILANAGICWEPSAWFFGANYSRIFAIDTTTNFSSDEIPEEHLDLLEVVAGYRFSDNFALTLSYEEQIGGDTLIEMKKHVILGVRLKL